MVIGKEKIRLFTAVDLPEDFKDRIVQYTHRIKRVQGLRFTSRDNLHVTTFFMGELDVHLVEDIARGLAMVSQRQRPFVLELDKICLAPAKNPYMIWGMFRRNFNFSEICRSIRDEMAFCSNNKNTDQLFVPHVTLARYKGQLEPDNISGYQGLSGFQSEINGFNLYQSTLTPSGPVYRKMEEFRFCI